MDPVHVAYGLLLIALATVGYTAANRALPWRLLATSSLLAGLGEWLEALMLPHHGGPLVAVGHAGLLMASAVLLVIAAHRTGYLRPRLASWLSIMGVGAVLLGLAVSIQFGVVVAVVIPGFMASAWSWWRAGRARRSTGLMLGAAIFVGMIVVLAAGIVASRDDPMVFHEGWRPWASALLVLGLIVVTAMASDHGLAAEHRRIRRAQGVLALGALVMVILGAAWFGRWQTERERMAVENELRIHATSIAAELRSRLEAGDIFAQMLAGRELVRRSLVDPALCRQLDHELAGLVDQRRISVLYVVDRNGLTIAASNHGTAESLVGRNFAFRSYVSQALAGGKGRQWALGSVTNLLGFYHAFPVHDEGGAVIGAAVIKQNAQLIKGLMPQGIQGRVLDETGRVFISSHDDDVIGQLPANDGGGVASVFRFDDQSWSVAMATTDGRLREAVLPVYLIMALLGLLVCPNFALLISREERRLEQARNRAILAQVVDASPDAIALVDGDGRIRLANRALVALHGQPGTDLSGLPVDAVLPGVPASGTSSELRLTTARRACVLLTTRVDLGQGSLVVAADVTALRRAVEDADAARRRVEELQRATAAYLTTISHEIRSPLGGVVSLAEVLAGGDLSPEQTERVDALRRSVEGILSLLNDVLDHGRLESGHLELVREPYDPAGVVMDVVELMLPRTAGRPVEVVVRTAQEVPARVLGDAGRLRQVIANLLSNALKFTERGDVVVDLAVPAPGRLRIVVADTGPGIPADRIDRIFSPFQQADASIANRFGGTGLGLSISNRLVAMMGGAITVESTPGRGSRFIVEVAAEAAGKHQPASDMVPRLPPVGARILVVDDHPLALQVMVDTLHTAGCRAVGAADGPQAMLAVQRAEADGTTFDALVVDRELPGHGGLWVVTAMRSRPAGARTPVVLLTGSPQRGDGEACAMAAIDAYLVKPARPGLLVAVVAKAIAERGKGLPLITRRLIDEERSRPRPPRPLRILLAEDLPLNRQVFSLLLEDAGCTVVAAEDGVQAQEILRRGGVDLVLMDVNMPRCDGRSATRAWRAAEAEAGLPRIPIIALTGEDGVDDRARCMASGMDDYLPKPFREEELGAILVRWSAART